MMGVFKMIKVRRRCKEWTGDTDKAKWTRVVRTEHSKIRAGQQVWEGH